MSREPSILPTSHVIQINDTTLRLPLGKTNRIDYASFTFQLLRIRIEKRAKTRRALFLSLFLKRLKLLTYRIDASRIEDWKRSARFYGRIRKVTRHVSFANLITIELAYIRFCYAERIKTSVKYIYIYIHWKCKLKGRRSLTPSIGSSRLSILPSFEKCPR